MKKTKVNFYEKYREEAQKKLDLWKELLITRQDLIKLIRNLDLFFEAYDTFGEKSIDTPKK